MLSFKGEGIIDAFSSHVEETLYWGIGVGVAVILSQEILV